MNRSMPLGLVSPVTGLGIDRRKPRCATMDPGGDRSVASF